MADFTTARNNAIVIRDETGDKANTATRVGTELIEIIDQAESICNNWRNSVADSTALIAIPEASISDRAGIFVGSDLYVYDAAATTGTYAPADQTGGTGFWIQRTGLTSTGLMTWQESTNGIVAVDGSRIIMQPNHDVNLPTAPTTSEEVWLAAEDGDWGAIAGGTGAINAGPGWTINGGATLTLAGSGVAHFVADVAETDWQVFLGGSTADFTINYANLAALPNPTTVDAGTKATVTNDGINNGMYLALGAPGGAGTSWSQV